MASLRREVLGGYKRLMRVRLIAFKDDSTMLEASKVQLRVEFNKNKAVTDPSKIAGLLKGVNEVEDMLKYNIAQARLNERGNYAVNVAPKTPDSVGGGEDTTIEVEHIDGKAGDLPADVTVTPSSCGAGAAPAAESGEGGSLRKRR
ncbi:unnamed protein product [Pylaiella littoralis]